MTAARLPHVVVLSPTAALGGAERSLAALVDATRTALAVTVVVPGDGPLARAARAAGARVDVVAWPGRLLALGERARGTVSPAALAGAVPGVAALVPRLRRRLRALAPDVVVTNGIKAHGLGALACPRGVPLVWYGREGLEGRPRSTQLLRLLGRRCDGAVAISAYVAGELARVLPARVPVATLPNLIDVEAFRPGLPPPPDLPKDPRELWFGVVGALTPLKGQDLFLAAAARVASVLPQARFLVVGGTPYASEADLGFAATLRSVADARGLAGRVRFLGEREDAPAIVANLDVLVQANRGPEGLGRTTLEAMACAVPVVSVDRWGPAELVRHGETGLTYPPGCVRSLAAHMAALGANPSLRRRLGDAGLGWMRRTLDRDAIARRAVELVRRCTAGRAPARAAAAQLGPAVGR